MTRLTIRIDPHGHGPHTWRRKIEEKSPYMCIQTAIEQFHDTWEIGEGMTLTIESMEEVTNGVADRGNV